ncbi:MAG TPA: MerR family transcriptional regulator [Herpetosiphonaceae bacterium]
MEQALTIQQLAEQTGLTAHTLRYYERIGLLDAVPRTAAGRRAYAASHLARARSIKHLRETGMSIGQIQEFVALYRQGEGALDQCCELLAAHRDRLNGQIAAIQGELAKLEGKLRSFRARADTLRAPELAEIAEGA